MELTHFWQAAQDLLNLTILGDSPDSLKHLFQSIVKKGCKEIYFPLLDTFQMDKVTQNKTQTLPKCRFIESI
jgi:hypothetical protein